MAGALDRLITRIELQDASSAGMEKAEKRAKELAKQFGITEDKAKKLDAAMKEMNGLDLGSIFNSFASEVMASNEAVQGFIKNGILGAADAGQKFGQVMSNAVTFLASPAGIGVAIASVTALLYGLASALSFTGGIAVGFGQSVITALSPIVGVLGELALPVLGSMMASPFVEASAAIDSTRRVFAALLGDFGKGEQMMKFVQQYGLKSPQEQGSLLAGTRTLLTSGQDVNRFLPVLDRLSMMAGDNLAQGMETLSNAVRYAYGGRTGEAVENLGQLGIGRRQLTAYGAKFDNQGQFQGTFEDFMNVLERLANSPVYDRLAQNVAGSTSVRQSNVQDVLNLAMQSAGEILSDSVLGVMESGAAAIKGALDSGVFKEAVGALVKMFSDPSSGMVKIVALVLAVVKNIPEMYNTAVLMFQAVQRGIFAGIMSVFGLIDTVGKMIGTVLPMVGAAIQGIAASGRAGMSIGSSLGSAFSALAFNGVLKDASEFEKRIAEGMSKGPGAAIKAPGSPPSPGTPPALTANEHLAAIRENTRKMVNFQRMTLGGRELAQAGISASEVHDITRGRSNTGRRIGDELENIIYRVIYDLQRQERRNGRSHA